MGNKRSIALNRNNVKIIILFLVFLPALPLEAQTKTERKVERREAQLERKESRDYEKRRKAALKHRYKIQTREVQDRMKESEKKAKKFNKALRDPFYKDLFKKKRRKGKNRKPR